MRFSCWKCGESMERLVGERVGRQEACPRCDSDLHCCRNCRFHDPGAHNQCRETQAEWVKEKDRSNFCDYFEPVEVVGARGRSANTAEDVKKKFDNLFKI